MAKLGSNTGRFNVWSCPHCYNGAVSAEVSDLSCDSLSELEGTDCIGPDYLAKNCILWQIQRENAMVTTKCESFAIKSGSMWAYVRELLYQVVGDLNSEAVEDDLDLGLANFPNHNANASNQNKKKMKADPKTVRPEIMEALIPFIDGGQGARPATRCYIGPDYMAKYANTKTLAFYGSNRQKSQFLPYNPGLCIWR